MRKVISIAVLLPMFGVANANTFCQGQIAEVAVSPNGNVSVNTPALSSSHVFLCNLGEDANGVGSGACKGILSVLLAAKATGSTVAWAFLDDSMACGQRPAWTTLSNWYWGPVQM
jgi:hypothetical protein